MQRDMLMYTLDSALVGNNEGTIKAFDTSGVSDDEDDDKGSGIGIGYSTAAVFAVPGRKGVRLAHSEPISALAWYPLDTGIFFSAAGSKVLVWDANAAQPVTAATFDEVVFDLAPHIVSGRPIVAGLF